MSFYNLARIAVNLYSRLMYNVEITGKEHIPSEGNYIVCSNHSTQLDPVSLAMVTRRKLNFMAKKELFEKPFLGRLIKALGAHPVDRDIADVSAIKNALRVLKRGELFAMFPEGTRTSEIDLDKAKAGISMISLKSKSPIIPVHIESEYRFRKPLKITIKKPMSFEDYYGRKLSNEDYVELSKDVLRQIYGIASQ